MKAILKAIAFVLIIILLYSVVLGVYNDYFRGSGGGFFENIWGAIKGFFVGAGGNDGGTGGTSGVKKIWGGIKGIFRGASG